MLGMPRSEWPADVLEELLIVPVRNGWFGCACSHAHQATPLSRPEPACYLSGSLALSPVGVSDCRHGSGLTSLAYLGSSGCWF